MLATTLHDRFYYPHLTDKSIVSERLKGGQNILIDTFPKTNTNGQEVYEKVFNVS